MGGLCSRRRGGQLFPLAAGADGTRADACGAAPPRQRRGAGPCRGPAGGGRDCRRTRRGRGAGAGGDPLRLRRGLRLGGAAAWPRVGLFLAGLRHLPRAQGARAVHRHPAAGQARFLRLPDRCRAGHDAYARRSENGAGGERCDGDRRPAQRRARCVDAHSRSVAAGAARIGGDGCQGRKPSSRHACAA